MGTASRKRRSDERLDRERARRLRAAAVAPKAARPLKVVVATFPDASPGGVSLARDVDLVRAALLYADDVELVSTGAPMLGGIASLAAQGEDAIFDLLAAQVKSTDVVYRV